MVTVQTRGLGKGLSALIADVEKTMEHKSIHTQTARIDAENGIREINLAQIVPGKYQPRTHFPEESLRELASSIARNGVVQPVVVRRKIGAPAERYELVAGERRWRAAKMAGLVNIPAVIREFTDIQALEIALIENVQRIDLSPLEEAAGYSRLMEEFRYTQEDLATAVGKSRSHIANLLRLLNLPPEVRLMLEETKITMGHARALLNLPERVAVPIARQAAEKGLSVRQVEIMVRGTNPDGTPVAAAPHAPRMGKTAAAMQIPKDPELLALEESLSNNLGLKVEIRDRGQGGELALCYDSLSQLDDILRRLGGDL